MKTHIIQYIAMSLDFFAALILMLILVCCLMEKGKTELLKIYLLMVASCMASLLLEATSYAMYFALPQYSDVIRTALSNAAIIGGYMLSFVYACYISYLIGPEYKLCRMVIKALKAVGLAAVLLLTAGSYFGLFFTIKNNDFQNGPLFLGVFAFDILACFAGIFLMIAYRKNLKKRDIIALSSMPTFIFISAFLQYVGYAVMIGLFLIAAISVVIIYLMIQADQNHQKAEQEKKLVDMNVSLMISQIQPHFLYNALSSIRRMIKKDPEVAETAVENFSIYLRQNLESMSRIEPIPFAQELNHLREYLYLENLRFGDRLQVDYDLAYEDFVLPALSLQPIVENAVEHGVLKKEEGGCVKISTRREGSAVILTVADDGVGFHLDSIPNNGRMHIGFDNVKKRIEMQCRGTVNIESEIGVGTTVTMTIPLI